MFVVATIVIFITRNKLSSLLLVVNKCNKSTFELKILKNMLRVEILGRSLVLK